MKGSRKERQKVSSISSTMPSEIYSSILKGPSPLQGPSPRALALPNLLDQGIKTSNQSLLRNLPTSRAGREQGGRGVARGQAYVMQEHQSERKSSQLGVRVQVSPGCRGTQRGHSLTFCSPGLPLSPPGVKPGTLLTRCPASPGALEPVGLASGTF